MTSQEVKKICINTKQLNNKITKANLMEIYQILFQGNLSVWNSHKNLQHVNTEYLDKGQKVERPTLRLITVFKTMNDKLLGKNKSSTTDKYSLSYTYFMLKSKPKSEFQNTSKTTVAKVVYTGNYGIHQKQGYEPAFE